MTGVFKEFKIFTSAYFKECEFKTIKTSDKLQTKIFELAGKWFSHAKPFSKIITKTI